MFLYKELLFAWTGMDPTGLYQSESICGPSSFWVVWFEHIWKKKKNFFTLITLIMNLNAWSPVVAYLPHHPSCITNWYIHLLLFLNCLIFFLPLSLPSSSRLHPSSFFFPHRHVFFLSLPKPPPLLPSLHPLHPLHPSSSSTSASTYSFFPFFFLLLGTVYHVSVHQ